MPLGSPFPRAIERRAARFALAISIVAAAASVFAQRVAAPIVEEIPPAAVISWHEIVRGDSAAVLAPVPVLVPWNPPPLKELAGRIPTPDTTLADPNVPIVQRQLCPDPSRPPSLVANFLGQPDTNTSIPPDTMGAAGPNHIMTMLNTYVRIQTRAGAQVSAVSLAGFWAPLGGTPFDPKIIFDAASGRWIATCDSGARSSQSRVFVAISDSDDPTTFWRYYSFVADESGDGWADYPGLGVNSKWIAISNNMFVVGGSQYLGAKLWLIEKPSALDGGSLFVHIFPTRFDLSGGVWSFTLQPCVTHDEAESALYFIDNPLLLDTDARPLLRLSRITGPIESPVWSAVPGSTIAPGIFRVTNAFNLSQARASQLGTTQRIETNDPRILNSVLRNGRVWFTHSGGLPATGTSTRTVVLWYQLNPTAMPSPIVQSGVIGTGNDVHHYFPSIAVNCANDACVGFTRSSATLFAEAVYATKLATSGANTFGIIRVLKAGEDSYVKDFASGRIRWGDYSATVVDPLDDRSFWTFQEYAETDVGPTSFDDRWGVWTGRVQVVTNDCNGNGVADNLDISSAASRDCNANTVPDECDLASGIATDCDDNGILDSCEIAGGDPDCNGNQVPDDCDISTGNALDCNGNGVSDDCDLISGTATDCNQNGVPDSCDVASGASPDCNGNTWPDECDLAPGPIEFAAVETTPLSRSPASIAVADIDRTNGPDLIVNLFGVTGSDPFEIQVWLNAGTGAFALAQSLNVGREARSVVVTDLNGDGWPDLAAGNAGDPTPTISIAFNNGSGGLSSPQNVPSSVRPGSIAVGDFNGDGAPDLFIAQDSNNSPNHAICVNLGGGAFSAPQTFYVQGGSTTFVAADDLDLDGVDDVLLVRDTANSVAVLFANGDGTFAAPQTYAVGSRPARAAIARLDSDGFPDLVVSNSGDGSVSVLRNLQLDRFAAAQRVVVGEATDGPADVEAIDLNGDSVRDLVTTLRDGDRISVVAGGAALTFGPPTFLPVGNDPAHVAGADFDLDGDTDLAVANGVGATLALLGNISEAPSALDCNANHAPDSCDIAGGFSADANGNGVPDECEPDCNGNGIADANDLVAGTSRDCDGNLVPDECDPDCNGNGVPDWCDVAHLGAGDCDLDFLPDDCEPDCDGDGAADVCELSPGALLFGDPLLVPLPAEATWTAAADLDHDGDADVALLVSDTSLLMYRNTGTTFELSVSHAVPNFTRGLLAADITGDGFVDLVAQTSGSNNLIWFRNDGAGNILPHQLIGLPASPSAVAAGDIDGDLDTDLVVGTSSSGTFMVRVLRNNGTGQFAIDPNGLNLGGFPRTLRVVDLESDGDLDIAVVTRSDRRLRIFVNVGGGTFAASGDYATGNDPSDLAAADLENDGDVDLLVSNGSDSSIQIYRNVGVATFVAGALLPLSGTPRWLLTDDLDDDGDIDIVVSAFPTYGESVYVNDGQGNFLVGPLIPSSVRGESSALADVDSDGRLDVISAGYTITGADFLVCTFNRTPPPSDEDCNANGTPDSCEWIPGDVTSDGVVSLVDLAILLSNFGSPGGMTRAQGDVSGDQAVDLLDLAILLTHFGQDCP